MNAKQIYSKTKKFPMRLLLLNLASVVGSLLVLAIFGGLGVLLENGMLIFGGIALALIAFKVSQSLIEHWIGYMFKYGAVYTIAKAHMTGEVSKDYFNEAVEYIKNGFLQANVYLVLDKLIHQAVRGVTRLVNFVIGFLPDNIKSFVDTFINRYLDYVDECCIAWAAIHPNQNAAKSSCDAIVIYYQNGKELLKPAFKTSLRIVIVKGIVVLIAFPLLIWWPLAVAWILFGLSIVEPFLNHRVLCETIEDYLELADKTQVQYDLYEKLSSVSAFKKLREKMNDPAFDPAPGNSQEVVNVVKKNVNVPKPVPEAVIPEAPAPEVSQEQLMWQQAWNRMTPQQKEKYKGMDEQHRLIWKKQIMKALFNYDM